MKSLQYTLMGVATTALALVVLAGCSTSRHATVLDHSAFDSDVAVSERDNRHSLAEAVDVIGMDIVGSDGETVGVLDDIVADRSSGRIAYGVLAYGGFAGLGEDFHAVPWESFSLTTVDGERVLSVNFTERSLEGVEGFSKDNWPLAPTFTPGKSTAFDNRRDVRDESMTETDTIGSDEDVSTYGYVGDRAYQADRAARPEVSDSFADVDVDALVANGRLLRLSKLIGWDFHHTEGNIGELEDIVIDSKLGHVAYGVIYFDGTVDRLDDRVAIIPWSSLMLRPRDTAVSLRRSVDADTLVAITFDRDSLPDLTDQMVAQQLHSQYEAEPYWGAYGYTGEDVKDGARELKQDVREGARELQSEGRQLKRDIDEEF